MMIRKQLLISLIVLLGLTCQVSAQIDAHYWTHQYGAKGLLLNGAVIASADDETNIFYNPGALSLNYSRGFAFSFLSPTYASIAANKFLSENSSLVNEGFDFSPGFLAVSFEPVENLTIGVASFERYKSNISFRERVAGPINQTAAFLLQADLDFERKISEDWFGVSLAYNVGDKLGIGISQFSVWRDASLHYNLKKEVLLSSNPNQVTASWRNEFGYDYSIYSAFITKLGLSYATKDFTLGLTYTSPIYGAIDKSVSYSLSDQRINPNSTAIEVVANRDDADLANYRSPHSVGLGIEIHKQKVCYSLSAEYFSSIKPYVIFKEADDPFDGTSQNVSNTIVSLEAGNQSVLNFAVGLQFNKTEKLTWLAGFRTDFNEQTNLVFNELNEYLGSMPSVYHLSGGAMIQSGNNTFSIGLDFGYGGKAGGKSLASFDDVTIDNLYSFSGKNNVNTDFYSVMLFLTYDFIFQNITTKGEEGR